MIELNYYIDIFNNREKAVILWLLIFLVWVLYRKDTRISFFGVLKALFRVKTAFAIMLLYDFLIILLFSKIKFWDMSLLKDTIYWGFGSSFVLLVNVDNATQDEHHFRKIILDNLKLILILEFIINLYSFTFWVELILVPVLVMIVAMSAVTKNKQEYLPLKNSIDYILAFLSFFLLVFTLFNIFSNYYSFATIDNLRSFVLPPLLTFVYIPFLYLFALFMAYESLFVHLDIVLGDDKMLAAYAKQGIFRLCFLNLGKLNGFAKKHPRDLLSLIDKE